MVGPYLTFNFYLFSEIYKLVHGAKMEKALPLQWKIVYAYFHGLT